MKSASENVTPAIVASGLVNKIHHRHPEKHKRDQSKSKRNFYVSDFEIHRNPVLALAGMRVTQHEHREPLHRETPNHAKRIKVCEEVHLAAADDDRQYLEETPPH